MGVRRRFRAKPDVVYRAKITTGSGVHKCSFIDQRHAHTAILANPAPFVMPADATFVPTAPIVATVPDRTLSGFEIEPVAPDSVDDEHVVKIPDDLKGRDVPAVEPDDEISIHYEENTPDSLWTRLGKKSNELL